MRSTFELESRWTPLSAGMTPRRARNRATPRWEYVEPTSVTLAPGGPTAPVVVLESAVSPAALVRLVSQTSSGSTWEIWLRTRSHATRVESAVDKAVTRKFFSDASAAFVSDSCWSTAACGSAAS